MGDRRTARESAVQLLFQLEFTPQEPQRALEEFWSSREAGTRVRRYTAELVQGVMANLDELDGWIRRCSQNWDIGRIGHVDRSVLRVAMFELLHRSDIPPVVAINEAVDIVKYYSSDESGRFVNGILDRARRELSDASSRQDGVGSGGSEAAEGEDPTPESGS